MGGRPHTVSIAQLHCHSMDTTHIARRHHAAPAPPVRTESSSLLCCSGWVHAHGIFCVIRRAWLTKRGAGSNTGNVAHSSWCRTPSFVSSGEGTLECSV